MLQNKKLFPFENLSETQYIFEEESEDSKRIRQISKLDL